MITKLRSIILCISLLSVLFSAGNCRASEAENGPDVYVHGKEKVPADLAVINARIFTSSLTNPWAEAVAVKGGRICYVGNISGISGYLGAQTEVIDARENMLVPGFVDNHCHVLWMGALRALMTTGLYEARSLEDVKRIVRDYASNNPQNPLIIALGWRYDYIPGGFPDKSLADFILNDRPLFLWSSATWTIGCARAARP